MQTNKKRIMITISPGTYSNAKRLRKPFSQTVEEALEQFLENKRKNEIRENLMQRANDPERDRLDLQIAEDFFVAESEAIQHEENL